MGKMQVFCRKIPLHPELVWADVKGQSVRPSKPGKTFCGADICEPRHACPRLLDSSITRYAPILNPKAGLGLQRQSARRQPVVQTQILVVQGLLCGHSSEKVPHYKGKGAGVQEKGGQNTDTPFLALRLGVVLYLPILGESKHLRSGKHGLVHLGTSKGPGTSEGISEKNHPRPERLA